MSLPLSPQSPKVSVCVITYNQERYIRECLQSLVDQRTSFDFEIVVGDDCSTDGTRAVIEEFVRRHPGRVRALFQPVNTSGSRNNLEVHAAARGEYVAHVDGDDYALPGKLQAQADLLDADPTCTAVWHRMDFFDDTGGFCSGTTADISSFAGGRVSFSDAVRLGFVGLYSALMYRRSARSPVDPSRLLLDLHWTWDLLSQGEGRFLDAVLGRYRVASSGSLTVTTSPRVRLLSIAHAEEFMARCPEHRRDFMVWAVCNAAQDLKHKRATGWKLLALAWRTRSFVSLSELRANVRRMRDIQVRWRQQRQQLPRSPKTGEV